VWHNDSGHGRTGHGTDAGILLLLARQLPYETGKAIDATTGRRSTLR
jgi:hypothetical protein